MYAKCRNFGHGIVPHFAHYVGEYECKRDNNIARQRFIRDFEKQAQAGATHNLFVEWLATEFKSAIPVPPVFQDPTSIHRLLVGTSEICKVQAVHVEKQVHTRVGKIIPDLRFDLTNGTQVCVEVVVTHYPEDKAVNAYRAEKVCVIQFEVSPTDTPSTDLWNKHTSWIYHPYEATLTGAIVSRYKSAIEAKILDEFAPLPHRDLHIEGYTDHTQIRASYIKHKTLNVTWMDWVADMPHLPIASVSDLKHINIPNVRRPDFYVASSLPRIPSELLNWCNGSQCLASQHPIWGTKQLVCCSDIAWNITPNEIRGTIGTITLSVGGLTDNIEYYDITDGCWYNVIIPPDLATLEPWFSKPLSVRIILGNECFSSEYPLQLLHVDVVTRQVTVRLATAAFQWTLAQTLVVIAERAVQSPYDGVTFPRWKIEFGKLSELIEFSTDMDASISAAKLRLQQRLQSIKLLHINLNGHELAIAHKVLGIDIAQKTITVQSTNFFGITSTHVLNASSFDFLTASVTLTHDFGDFIKLGAKNHWSVFFAHSEHEIQLGDLNVDAYAFRLLQQPTIVTSPFVWGPFLCWTAPYSVRSVYSNALGCLLDIGLGETQVVVVPLHSDVSPYLLYECGKISWRNLRLPVEPQSECAAKHDCELPPNPATWDVQLQFRLMEFQNSALLQQHRKEYECELVGEFYYNGVKYKSCGVCARDLVDLATFVARPNSSNLEVHKQEVLRLSLDHNSDTGYSLPDLLKNQLVVREILIRKAGLATPRHELCPCAVIEACRCNAARIRKYLANFELIEPDSVSYNGIRESLDCFSTKYGLVFSPKKDQVRIARLHARMHDVHDCVEILRYCDADLDSPTTVCKIGYALSLAGTRVLRNFLSVPKANIKPGPLNFRSHH